MYHSGFDYFTPDAGKHESMQCAACEQVMDVKRIADYYGRWGPSREHLPRKVDIFTCANAGSDWHDQVIALKRFQRDTPSQILSQLVEPEIVDIIKTKKITKEHYFI